MLVSDPPSRAPLAALDDVLSGRLGAAAVRRLAVDPMSNGLDGLLAECLAGRLLEAPRLLRTKYKPDRKLTAYYELAAADDPIGPRHAAVSWHHGAAGPTGAASDAALPRQARGPFHRLEATSADGRIALVISPADRSMSQLARLSRSDYLADRIVELAAESVPPPDLAISTVRYRPGQRHVLRAIDTRGWAWFVKTDRDASGIRAISAAAALGAALAGTTQAAAIVRPLGYVSLDRAAIWHAAPGLALSLSLGASPAGAMEAVRLLGQVARRVHDVAAGDPDADGVGELPAHNVVREAAATLRAGEHVDALEPSLGRTFRALLDDAIAGLQRLPDDAPTLVHGDLKSDNVLVDDGRIHIVDLDRTSRAEPAMDLGKFLADVEWWSRSRGVPGDALTAEFRRGYGTCDPLRWNRAKLLAVVFRLKLGARRHAVHEEAWPRLVEDQLSDASVALRAVLGAR